MSIVVHPNILTTFRMILAVIIGVSLLISPSLSTAVICLCLFSIAALTDWWDGNIARRYQLVTNYGKIADPLADKMLILGVLLVFSVRGLFSIWWLALVFLREIIVTVIRFEVFQQGKAIAAEATGKAKTVVQMVTVLACFAFLIIPDILPISFLNSFLASFMGIMLFLTNLLTVYSGIVFFQNLEK